ncbi:MAG TPA: ketose-bisphosphate aldolase [Prolixibacteraceae bacterium]|nr:ketose-bisphosphate aldolase [Prolixibacteraceae bacterium]
MPLVNMTEMLIKAREGKYAVGAFNILDYNSMRVVVETAQELQSPVIVQTSEKTIRFWGLKPIVSWIKELTDNTTVPVAIHLDHCKDLSFIQNCIDAGWTSVMIDASSKPFEENIKLSQQVVKMAKLHEISVEAELGEIGGIEDDISINEESAHLAGVEQAKIFLDKVKVECFAPAIGTSHGIYKGEPNIAFDRLNEISQLSDTPLALHGGTGLSAEVFKKCISLGCSKINISTQLKYAFIDGFLHYYQSKPTEYNPLTILQAQYIALKQAVYENIILFGSNQKA